MKKAIAMLTIIGGLFGAPLSFAGDYERCLNDAQEKAVNPWQLENLQELCVRKHIDIQKFWESLRREIEERDKIRDAPENQLIGTCVTIVGGKPFGYPNTERKGSCIVKGHRWLPTEEWKKEQREICKGHVDGWQVNICRSSELWR